MVIRAPDVMTITANEPEDNSILLVDPDAIKPREIALQLLQSIRRWNPKIFHRSTGI